MTDGARSRSPLEVIEGDADGPGLTSRCSRPQCRGEFTVKVTPGRRRTYCSTTCRSIAEKEYKQALAAVSHYERLLEDARNDAAAFGRSGDGNERPRTSEENDAAGRRAQAAWASAETAVQFAQPGDERLYEILQTLVGSLEYKFQ
jgi:hypothetical protein